MSTTTETPAPQLDGVQARALARLVAAGTAKHGDKFDAAELTAAGTFAEFAGRDFRVKVRTTYGDEIHERTGRVGMTTG